MKINEVFYAVQGEGPEMGTPTMFIRFAGCNLDCGFCDSKYAKKGDEVSVSQLEQIIKSQGRKNMHFTVTGGEPTLQEKEFLEFYKNHPGDRFSIETNGTKLTTIAYDTIVISPKKQRIVENVLSEYADMNNTHFKFVYEPGQSKWWEKVITDCCIPRSKVYIMPEGMTRKEQIERMPEVIEYCKDNGFKFSPRIHVLAYNKKRKV